MCHENEYAGMRFHWLYLAARSSHYIHQAQWDSGDPKEVALLPNDSRCQCHTKGNQEEAFSHKTMICDLGQDVSNARYMRLLLC